MRCVSSQIFTVINTLSNPEGQERNWTSPIEYVNLLDGHKSQTAKLREVQVIKRVIGQIASFAIVVPIAVVETVVYTVLTAFSVLFYQYSHHKSRFFIRLLQSSTFTYSWAFSSPIYLGCFSKKYALRNLPTKESFARQIMTLNWFPTIENKIRTIREYLPTATLDFLFLCTLNDRIWKHLLETLNAVPNRFKDILYTLHQFELLAKENTPLKVIFASMHPQIKDLFKHVPQFENLLRDLAEITLYKEVEDNEDYMYRCIISLMPVLDPVQDPTAISETPALYERKMITQWLRNNSCSPLTRAPLTISELLEIDNINFPKKDRAGIKEQQEKIARRRQEKIATDLSVELLANNLVLNVP